MCVLTVEAMGLTTRRDWGGEVIEEALRELIREEFHQMIGDVNGRLDSLESKIRSLENEIGICAKDHDVSSVKRDIDDLKDRIRHGGPIF